MRLRPRGRNRWYRPPRSIRGRRSTPSIYRSSSRSARPSPLRYAPESTGRLGDAPVSSRTSRPRSLRSRTTIPWFDLAQGQRPGADKRRSRRCATTHPARTAAVSADVARTARRMPSGQPNGGMCRRRNATDAAIKLLGDSARAAARTFGVDQGDELASAWAERGPLLADLIIRASSRRRLAVRSRVTSPSAMGEAGLLRRARRPAAESPGAAAVRARRC
jgi:hypothetical protein